MCPAQLLVTMDQVSEYTGIYNYVAELNGAPYYAQNNGPGYVYKLTNDNNNFYWHMSNHLGIEAPSFYSSNNTKCPEEAIIWKNYSGKIIILENATPGFNVVSFNVSSPSESLRYYRICMTCLSYGLI